MPTQLEKTVEEKKSEADKAEEEMLLTLRNSGVAGLGRLDERERTEAAAAKGKQEAKRPSLFEKKAPTDSVGWRKQQEELQAQMQALMAAEEDNDRLESEKGGGKRTKKKKKPKKIHMTKLAL